MHSPFRFASRMPGRTRHDIALRERQLQPDDMEDAKTQNGRGRPEGDASEFGVVRVFSNPGPDAEDRLRRLFTLLLEHAARDRQTASEKDSPPDARYVGDHPEAEA